MVLSRIWYLVLSLLLAIAVYIVYLAVGQYNRRNAVAMNQELAGDSQVVGWALQIDARHRLDALLAGALDKGVQDALATANDKDKIPPTAKDGGRKALTAILDKVPAEYRSDALFAVDHDGRVISQVGFDAAAAFDDFEMGGYPAVFDALHGFLRDDTWVLGGKVYRVVARPVEFDVTQRPLGAIVGFKLVDDKFVADLSKRTRTNLAFYAQGQRVATAVQEGFEKNSLDLIRTDLPKLDQDKSYADGRSDVHQLSDAVSAMYARLPGEAWDLGAGFVVARQRIAIAGPVGFLNGADDTDKKSVNWLIVVAVVLLGVAGGIGLSVLEMNLPLNEMQTQADRLRRGDIDYLQLPRFRGSYRTIAQNVNAGIERVLEKGGGAVRRPADLESILGPVPAQPAMSAFSFPMGDPQSGGMPPTGRGPGAPYGPPAREAFPTRPGVPPGQGGPIPPAFPSPGPPIAIATPFAAGPPGQPPAGVGPMGTMAMQAPSAPRPFAPPRPYAPGGGPPPPFGRPGMEPIAPLDAEDLQEAPTIAAAEAPMSGHAPGGGPPPPRINAGTIMGIGGGMFPPPPAMGPPPAAGNPAVAMPAASPFNVPTTPNQFFPPGASPGGPPLGQGLARPPGALAPPPRPGSGPKPSPAGAQLPNASAGDDEQEEATVVAPAPNDLLAQASGEHAAGAEAAEWLNVYDDFLRTKKQCGEPTDGLTFEKFQNTLRKNRDSLMQRHGCKRVRFSVYIKEGRASLKATPVRE